MRNSRDSDEAHVNAERWISTNVPSDPVANDCEGVRHVRSAEAHSQEVSGDTADFGFVDAGGQEDHAGLFRKPPCEYFHAI